MKVSLGYKLHKWKYRGGGGGGVWLVSVCFGVFFGTNLPEKQLEISHNFKIHPWSVYKADYILLINCFQWTLPDMKATAGTTPSQTQ